MMLDHIEFLTGQIIEKLIAQDKLPEAFTMLKSLTKRFVNRGDRKDNLHAFRGLLTSSGEAIVRSFQLEALEFYAKTLEDLIEKEGNEDSSINLLISYRDLDDDSMYTDEMVFTFIKIVRDAMITLLQQDNISEKDVLSIIVDRPLPIFKRLTYYIYAKFPDKFKEQICEIISSETSIAEIEEEFHDIVTAAQKDLSLTIPSTVAQHYLIPRSKYPHVTSRWGGKSPYTVKEIKDFSPEELIIKLSSFSPSGDFYDPSKEGLYLTLTQAAQQNALTFSTNASKFVDLEIKYIQSILSGIAHALREKGKIKWSGVIPLLEKVIFYTPNEEDPGTWYYTQQTAGDIVSIGLTKRHIGLPLDKSEKLLKLLKHQLQAVDISISNDRNSDKGYAKAINTIKGRATEALISYALRIAREKSKAAVPPVIFDFIKDILQEAQISSPLRSVFGVKFPNLWYLDPSWAETHVRQIFHHANFNDAAWRNQILHCDPYLDLWPLLRTLYMEAVYGLHQENSDSSNLASYRERLVGHVFYLFLSSREANRDLQHLVDVIFHDGEAETKREAARYLATVAIHQRVNAGVRILIRHIVDARLANIKKLELKEYPLEEMEEYLALLSAKRVRLTWRAKIAAILLSAPIKMRRSDIVFEFLTELAEFDSNAALNLLEQLAKHEQVEFWYIYSNAPLIKKILDKASHETPLHIKAERIRSILLSKGYHGVAA